jgi:pimeloyl-ACP methyl ester carboxylesterase
MKKKFIFLFLIFIILSSLQSQTNNIDGHWEGSIIVLGGVLDIKTDFKTEADSIIGTIDIPKQNASGLKLIHISVKGDKVYFELPAAPGLAIFDGKQIGDSVAGSFTQAGFSGTFSMIKGGVKSDTSKANINPYFIENAPYKQEEVSFTNGENSFAGTLTIPNVPGRHPVVVMITGSGPQNRDEEIVGFKPFRIIADHLTRSGIAVLRYDDRNVGGSKGKPVSESTTEDFAGDVIEAVKYLKTRDDINGDQVGLLGHSEGGIVAPLVASQYNGIAYIVLMAGTGVMGIDILKEQSKLIMKANNATDDEINGYMKMLEQVYDAVKTGTGWDELKKKFRESMELAYKKMTKEQKKSIPDKKAYINMMADAAMSELKSPWMKYFIQYDPYPALTKVTCPVLLLFGEKDLQVPTKQNEKPMTDALTKGGNKEVALKIFPDANHLFQKAVTGNPSEYATLPMEFVPGFLETIGDWITARVSIVK